MILSLPIGGLHDYPQTNSSSNPGLLALNLCCRHGPGSHDRAGALFACAFVWGNMNSTAENGEHSRDSERNRREGGKVFKDDAMRRRGGIIGKKSKMV